MLSNRRRRIGWLSLLSLTALLLGCRSVDQPGLTQHGGDGASRMSKRNVVPAAVARSRSAEPSSGKPVAGSQNPVRTVAFQKPAEKTHTSVDPAIAEFSRAGSADVAADADGNPVGTAPPTTTTSAPLQLPPPAPAVGDDKGDDNGDAKSGSEPALLDTLKDARPIDLSTALALVAGRNPQVALVQQRVQEAFAELDAAEVLWLPSLRGGVSYNKREGTIQDVAGQVIDVSRSSVFSGFGAQAVGTGSPAVSGLSAQFHLADAIFQPVIARRTANARQHRVIAVTNDQLLAAALAHIELVRAVAGKRIALQTLRNLQKLARLTTSFAKRGEGTQADADRAQTELNLQKNVVTRADEQIRVASAVLTEVLNLDDNMSLRPVEAQLAPIDLVPAETDVSSLIAQAVSNRPEMSENRLQISAAVNRLKRERYSPLVPNVGLGVSYGGFGGGEGDTVAEFRDRFDVDAVLYWEVRNLGLGERAARDAARSRIHQTQSRRVQLTNRIRREVTEAHARLISARQQRRQAQASVQSAEESLQRNFQRIRQGEGLPLEVLQSIQALDAANRERLKADAAYNRAQFLLHRALGWPESAGQ